MILIDIAYIRLDEHKTTQNERDRAATKKSGKVRRASFFAKETHNEAAHSADSVTLKR